MECILPGQKQLLNNLGYGVLPDTVDLLNLLNENELLKKNFCLVEYNFFPLNTKKI